MEMWQRYTPTAGNAVTTLDETKEHAAFLYSSLYSTVKPANSLHRFPSKQTHHLKVLRNATKISSGKT